MNPRVLVTGEADEPHLALALGLLERLDDAAAREVPVRIVVVHALVNLPEVEVIGLQPAQRLFELPHRLAPVAAVRTHLRHQEDLVPAAGERLAHDFLRLAVVVFPRVVHERDAGVDRGPDDADAFALGCFRDVIAAESERRDEDARRAKRPTWNLHETSPCRCAEATLGPIMILIRRKPAVAMACAPPAACCRLFADEEAYARTRQGHRASQRSASRGVD